MTHLYLRLLNEWGAQNFETTDLKIVKNSSFVENTCSFQMKTLVASVSGSGGFGEVPSAFTMMPRPPGPEMRNIF